MVYCFEMYDMLQVMLEAVVQFGAAPSDGGVQYLRAEYCQSGAGRHLPPHPPAATWSGLTAFPTLQHSFVPLGPFLA